MSDAKVRGVVHLVEETKSYGQSGFQKRLVVLEQDQGRFTSYIPLELIRDHCPLADELNVGDEVEASYRLNGRKWQRDERSEVKYFLSAEVTGFEVLHSAAERSTVDANAELNAAANEEDVPF
ncbi:MAG: DUF3127 domain-containing protein [Planctomycetales bacterium]|nr:DUF3127 domain-containing protein [Planctomycetales bacterium]